MKVLLVKLSSLGDVVHTFPALTDARTAIPGLELDWAVEEAFAPVARLHPAVRNVITVPLRRLLRNPLAAFRGGEVARIRAALAAEPYDLVIDAQGLMKSAAVAALARGPRHGFDRASARETAAALTYSRRHHVPEVEHMAVRIRKLFAAALGYGLEGRPADAGLRPAPVDGAPYLVFLHGTTWPTKTWSLAGWRALADLAGAAGLEVVLFAHGPQERARADAIAEGLPQVRLLPPQTLETLAPVIAGAAGVVSVDTGLGHLAAACGVPTVGLYGPTDPRLTGLYGPRALELKARRPCAPCEKAVCRIAPETREGPPCLADIAAVEVWNALTRLRAGAAMDKA
ncbi:lipopolysaccharide heptosyltransferase I [Xanthobacter dioxanivorans]|uniref:Lipopolysaccharide heptosyltransferase 1 n=1 Tax=Xanthobacter dioxanivorans TaxID=2528964 RepID=A0A974PLL9_9HYPH|nr:lipopolysaccharide heptosyltransferase I [Xanthobacter dioxanivorans]QRG05446.1 lipopolysaccharide heptosyltransferase I [Xanthobacter dioxanivorans]